MSTSESATDQPGEAEGKEDDTDTGDSVPEIGEGRNGAGARDKLFHKAVSF